MCEKFIKGICLTKLHLPLARIAMKKVSEALQQNRETVSNVLKDEVIGEIQDENHKLREKGLVQKMNQNMNETKLDFRSKNTRSYIKEI